MKEHHFRIQDAIDYGAECAVILYAMREELHYLRITESNVENGRVWTKFNLMNAGELFPYLSEDKIWNILKKLIDDGIILYHIDNKSDFDKRVWFSINEPEYEI